MGWMITTKDNPHDPTTDFRSWYLWDEAQGYHTSSYLARIVAVAEEFPEAVQDANVETAIDEIIEMHNGEIYKKVWVDEPSTKVSSAA